jgi:hypothetical protein
MATRCAVLRVHRYTGVNVGALRCGYTLEIRMRMRRLLLLLLLLSPPPPPPPLLLRRGRRRRRHIVVVVVVDGGRFRPNAPLAPKQLFSQRSSSLKGTLD